MEISIAKTDRQEETEFIPQTVKTIADLVKIATTNNWSTAVFNNNYRNTLNFKYATYMALDIDNNDDTNVYTMAQAKKDFKDYEFAIMPSRNHMKDKKGIISERFRIVVKLAEVITDSRVFTATYEQLKTLCPPGVCDKTNDAARYWFKSPFIDGLVYFQGGKGFKVYEPEPVQEIDIDDYLDEGEKGKLSVNTLRFLMEGAEPGTGREPKLYKAARDFNEQGYAKSEAIKYFEEMSCRVPNWYQKGLSHKDLSTIERAYSQPPKHAPRIDEEKKSPFSFGTIKQHVEKYNEFQWLCQDLLLSGGFSVIVADPKWGKSTITRQLAKSVVYGESFLGRDIKQGKVLYFAFEEESRMLAKQFQAVGMDLEHENFILHVGDVFDPEAIGHFSDAVADYKPDLVVLDKLFDLSNLESINSYKEVNDALKLLRKVARDNDCHIIGVHHTNKNDRAGNDSSAKVMGSNAIYGAVDAMLIGYRERDRRFITTTGRGTDNFIQEEIMFDSTTQSYSLKTSKYSIGA